MDGQQTDLSVGVLERSAQVGTPVGGTQGVGERSRGRVQSDVIHGDRSTVAEPFEVLIRQRRRETSFCAVCRTVCTYCADDGQT